MYLLSVQAMGKTSIDCTENEQTNLLTTVGKQKHLLIDKSSSFYLVFMSRSQMFKNILKAHPLKIKSSAFLKYYMVYEV